jgi:hypothetical protein
MPGNQGEVDKGLAYLKSVEIFSDMGSFWPLDKFLIIAVSFHSDVSLML